MKLSNNFYTVVGLILFGLAASILGGVVGQTLEQTERGETMTIMQVNAWCTYANAVDYYNSGATEQQVREAIPKMQKFCGESINHFLRMLEGQEGALVE